MKSRTARIEGAQAGRNGSGRGKTGGSKSAEKRPRKSAEPEARWSARVTRESDAMDLEAGVFNLGSSRAIAASLKRSSEASRRRKADAFRSAMSMLNFYINRAGRNLSGARLDKLDGAKRELRRLFGKPEENRPVKKRPVTYRPVKNRAAKNRAAKSRSAGKRPASRARPGAGSLRGRRGAR